MIYLKYKVYTPRPSILDQLEQTIELKGFKKIHPGYQRCRALK